MSEKRDRIERLLDEAVREIRGRKVDGVVVKETVDRVWTTLSSGVPGESQPRAAGPQVVGDCNEFRGLIKPYLNRELSEPRSLLLEDHLSECFSCQRELKIARDGVGPVPPVPYRSTGWSRPVWLGVAAAAVVLVALGLGRLGLWERAEVTIRETHSGRTIDLHRGNIIVQAVPQKDGFLKVTTDDCLVQVKGTVFSVSRGLKGSRVSVIEGVVSMESQGKRYQLKAGQQMSTRKSLTSVPLEKEIAWSRNLNEHIALLHELTSLQEELGESLTPGLTFSTSLLALIPEDAVLYASLPNLSGGILEAFELFE